jgi:type II secretory pathway component PulM
MSLLERLRRDRSEREMRALAWGAAAVALVLVYALAWLPLERARARLAAELPALRASAEAMQRQADEVRRLRALPPAANQQAPVSALAATPPAGAQVTALDPKRVRVSASDAAFTTLLEWIVAAQASHGLHVESARLDALATPGRVKADIVLSRS